ncbi:MAG: hypothetical protein PHX58_01690 [Desulfovibrio sp.]|nr:hypothetical protein [Desulfovibrio sp.]
MRYDYLVLGNCQSRRIASRLARDFTVKNYLLSYPGFFPTVRLPQQKEFLVKTFGTATYRAFLKSGILLPIPSVNDLTEHSYEHIVLTIPHKRNIYEFGDGIFLGANVDIKRFGILCTRHHPRKEYVDSFQQLIKTLQHLFPAATLTIVLRASARYVREERSTCWFYDWQEYVEEFDAKILSGLSHPRIRFVFLDTFLAQYSGPLENLYIDGNRVVDVEHLPGKIWDAVAREVAHPGLKGEEPPASLQREDNLFEPLVDYQTFLALCGMTQFHGLQGSTDKAVAYYQQALQCHSFRPHDLANAMASLLGTLDQQTVLGHAETMLQSMQLADTASVYKKLYSTLIDLNQLENAEHLFSRLPRGDAETLLARGVHFRKYGNPPSALQSFYAAEQAANEQEIANTAIQEQSVTLFEQGEHQNAIANLRRASRNKSFLEQGNFAWSDISTFQKKRCVIIGAAPNILVAFLLDKLQSVCSSCTLITQKNFPAQLCREVDSLTPLPDGRLESASAQESRFEPIKAIKHELAVIPVTGFNVSRYANVSDFTSHLSSAAVYFYSMQQIIHGYHLDQLFRLR